MTVQRNVEGLRQNAQRKRQEALDKVEQGIRQLLKESRTVNFNTVAQAADVSKAFLYKEPEIKERIEHLRQQGVKKKPESKKSASDKSKDAIIRTLRERLKKIEVEIRDLRRQNEIAYGQVIEINSLRQQAGRLQAENDRLRQQLSTDSNVQPLLLNISNIEAEIRGLGIELNTTIKKLLVEAPPEAVRRAIESLKEAVAQTRVESRAGFLNKAIRDAWKPNEKYEEKLEQALFNEWFPLAQQDGVVQASTIISGVQHVLTTEGEWLPFAQAFLLYPQTNKAKKMD